MAERSDPIMVVFPALPDLFCPSFKRLASFLARFRTQHIKYRQRNMFDEAVRSEAAAARLIPCVLSVLVFLCIRIQQINIS